MSVYGYVRVSTTGQSLKDQVALIKKQGVRTKNIYHEKYTGTTTKYPELDKLLNKLKPNDVLVIVKLDRLARNVREALNVVHDLKEKNVTIKVIDPKMTVSNDLGVKIMYNTLLMVADIERNMIIERTQAEKAYAKSHKKNYREGRRLRTDPHSDKYDYYLGMYKMSQKFTTQEVAKHYNICPRTVKYNKAQFKRYFAEQKKKNKS